MSALVQPEHCSRGSGWADAAAAASASAASAAASADGRGFKRALDEHVDEVVGLGGVKGRRTLAACGGERKDNTLSSCRQSC